MFLARTTTDSTISSVFVNTSWVPADCSSARTDIASEVCLVSETAPLR